MVLKKTIYSSALVILLSFFTVSCSVPKNPGTTSAAVPGAVQQTDVSANSKLQSLLNSLKNNTNVDSYSISHDETKIAVLYKSTSQTADLRLVTVADGKQAKVSGIEEGATLHDFTWSYDDKYFTVNDGTAATVATYIFNAATLKKQLGLTNVGMVWAYNSDSAAFSIVNHKVKTTVETELGGSTDVVVYNVDTRKHRTVLKAGTDYYYNPIKWDGQGLSVDQCFLSDGHEEGLLLKIYEHFAGPSRKCNFP